MQIAVKALRENLPNMLGFIEKACQQYQLSRQASLDVRLAVEEACVNLIKHGYAGLPPGMIEITFLRTDQQVQIAIMDFGHEFDPTTFHPPDRSSEWDQRPIGGLGIFFILQVMDEVRYTSNPGQGNRLELVKKIS